LIDQLLANKIVTKADSAVGFSLTGIGLTDRSVYFVWRHFGVAFYARISLQSASNCSIMIEFFKDIAA